MLNAKKIALLIFLGLLVGGGAFAESQHTPAYHDNNQYGNSTTYNAYKNNDLGKSLEAFFIKNVSNPKNNKTGDSKDQNYKWYNVFPGKPTDWLLVLFNFLLAAFTFLLWLTTKNLWKVSHGQLIAMEKHGEELKRSVEIAKISADAAQKSAEALLTTEKAYVFVTVEHKRPEHIQRTGGGYEGNMEFGANVLIWNYGKTPAIIKIIRIVICLDEAIIPEIDEIAIPEGLVLGSDKWKRQPSTRNIREADVRDISIGNKPAYCCGRIGYEDVFGGKYTTGFCWEYRSNNIEPGAGWVISHRYENLNYYKQHND